jgi:alpha-glucosidase
MLGFERAGGIRCVTNFGSEPIALPRGDVLLTSAALDAGRLLGDTAVWLRTAQRANKG